MKRGKPLRRTQMRRTWMKKGKRKSKYARRERDIDYMLWCKTLPCLLAGLEGAGPCSSVVEPDHVGLDSGIGCKPPDDTCVPLCSAHHVDRHAHTGYFRDRPKAWIRDWRLNAIAETQALHSGASFGEVVF